MPEGQLQHPWPELPPGQKTRPGTRAWVVLRKLREGGWLRPRRLGCLFVVLIVLVFLALWVLGAAVNQITAVFRHDPPPVAGSPFDRVVPSSQPTSRSPADDLVTDGKLIVAIQDVPGLAERVPGGGTYTGFDIALLDLIARDLGVDPAQTIFKPVPPGVGAGMLMRREADLVLGGFEITPARAGDLGIAGPYLVSPLRLAVPADSPATSLNSLGDGDVCAPRDSPSAAALAGRLADRLTTRTSLRACANLLTEGSSGSGGSLGTMGSSGAGRVQAIAGDQIALAALPATKSGSLRLLDEQLGTTEYGIGLPPGNSALRNRVNAVLRTTIDDGTWARLYAQYLGTPVPPPPVIR